MLHLFKAYTLEFWVLSIEPLKHIKNCENTLQDHLGMMSDSGPWAHFSQFALRNAPSATEIDDGLPFIDRFTVFTLMLIRLSCLTSKLSARPHTLCPGSRSTSVLSSSHGVMSALRISSSCTDDVLVSVCLVLVNSRSGAGYLCQGSCLRNRTVSYLFS